MALLPGWSPLDREALLHTVVSGGGAMLLAYAWYARATDRASQQQTRGLTAAGVGFLASVGASIYLREHVIVGPVVSLAGCVVALVGMRAVLRDRLDRQDAARRQTRRGRAGE